MEVKRYEFDPKQAYQLVVVTNPDGSAKTERLDFYSLYLNNIAVNLHYDREPTFWGYYRLWLEFVQDSNGKWLNRSLHTSIVYKVEETDSCVKIHTNNSIYHLQKAKIQEPVFQEDAELIELYLSLQEHSYFCKGFYYDENSNPHELFVHINIGFAVDTALIGTAEDAIWGVYACRYYIRPDKIEFYDTLYGQQDYSKPILIHNIGNKDLVVGFEFFDHTWTIKPGESKRIVSYNPTGVDEKQQQESCE